MSATVIPFTVDLAKAFRVVVDPGCGFTDRDLESFCAKHSELRIERNARGELIIMSPTSTTTGGFTTVVLAQLSQWAKIDKRGFVLSSNAGITLPDGSMLSPDASWISREAWKAVAKKERDAFARIVPSFVLEIRSRADRLRIAHAKMRTYLLNGVELAWLIDPLEKRVEIYRQGQEGPEVLEDPRLVNGEGPVAGFSLNLDEVYESSSD